MNDEFYKKRLADIAAMSGEVRSALSSGGTSESLKQKVKNALTKLSRKTPLPHEDHTYNPNSAGGFFVHAVPGRDYFKLNKNGAPRRAVSLDIETDDRGIPISVAAVGGYVNASTGGFEYTDQYQRFYNAQDKNLMVTSAIHGYSSADLKNMRKQQGAEYSSTYNEKEAQSLLDYIADAMIVGHNVGASDLKHLFPGKRIYNQVFDTLTASRNMWESGPNVKVSNKLGDVYKRIFGHTMAQDGLQAHDPMADSIATMKIATWMKEAKGPTGSAVRHMFNNPGTYVAPIDRGLINPSQIASGSWTEYPDISDYIDITDDKLGKNKTGGTMDTEAIKLFMDSLGDISARMKASNDATRDLARYLNESTASLTASQNRSLISQMAKGTQSPKDLEEYYKGLGFSPSGAISLTKSTLNMREMSLMRAANEDTHMVYWNSPNHQGFETFVGRMKNEEAYAWANNDWFKTADAALANPFDLNKVEGHELLPGGLADKVAEFLRNPESYDERYKFEDIKLKDMMADLKAEGPGGADYWNNGAIMYGDMQKKHREATEENTKALYLLDKSMSAVSQKLYDFTKVGNAARSEIGGIAGAASDLLPSILQKPFGRGMNALQQSIREMYAHTSRRTSLVQTGLDIISMAGAASGNPALYFAGKGISGGVGAITQYLGQRKEAQFTEWGAGIQNNLFTLNALYGYIKAPFDLLGGVIKRVVNGFFKLIGAISKLVGFLSSTFGDMAQMGNPITAMTGVGYGSYMSTLTGDYASLLGKGTINGMMESFASERAGLYTMGRINQNRLVAASMLGQFENVYGVHAGEESAVESMFNDLLARSRNMDDFQRKQLYDTARIINPNLPDMLQSANTLGLDSYEQLKNGHGMFYRGGEADKWRSGWQTAQWQWQTGMGQFDISKRRIATGIWNMGGSNVMNGFNRVLDKVANAFESGNWSDVIKEGKDLWAMIKEVGGKIWEGIKEITGIESDNPFDFIKSALKEVAHGTVDIIGQIAGFLNDAFTGVLQSLLRMAGETLDYLSTFRFDIGKVIDNFKETGEISLEGALTFASPENVAEKITKKKYKNKAQDSWVPFLQEHALSSADPDFLAFMERSLGYDERAWKEVMNNDPTFRSKMMNAFGTDDVLKLKEFFNTSVVYNQGVAHKFTGISPQEGYVSAGDKLAEGVGELGKGSEAALNAALEYAHGVIDNPGNSKLVVDISENGKKMVEAIVNSATGVVENIRNLNNGNVNVSAVNGVPAFVYKEQSNIQQ